MNEDAPWVASLDEAETASLEGLRLWPGLEIAAAGTTVWLRAGEWSEALVERLRRVPGLQRFRILAGGLLQPEGAAVPRGRLPELRWQSLRAWMTVRFPSAVEGLADPPRLALQLVRSSVEQPVHGMVMTIEAWRDFAGTAAAVRLRGLRFAAARDGRVFVEGVPMPSVAGERYQLAAGIATPAGFTWLPAIDATVLRRWLGLAEGDLALASEQGTWEIIKAEQFMPASRSAARRTAEALLP